MEFEPEDMKYSKIMKMISYVNDFCSWSTMEIACDRYDEVFEKILSRL